jgi:hypothetical protein
MGQGVRVAARPARWRARGVALVHRRAQRAVGIRNQQVPATRSSYLRVRAQPECQAANFVFVPAPILLPHNPKVAGSNPAPATKQIAKNQGVGRGDRSAPWCVRA